MNNNILEEIHTLEETAAYICTKLKEKRIELGCKKIPPRYYKHYSNPNYVEFPTGPVSLGSDLTKEFSELKTH